MLRPLEATSEMLNPFPEASRPSARRWRRQRASHCNDAQLVSDLGFHLDPRLSLVRGCPCQQIRPSLASSKVSNRQRDMSKWLFAAPRQKGTAQKLTTVGAGQMWVTICRSKWSAPLRVDRWGAENRTI
jgi:hypothetical protein